MDARVALTLRTLGGLTTAEIARAFLVPEPTMAQRLVRAKRKIAAAQDPLPRPRRRRGARPPGRVLAVVYLVFNEGYAASAGDRLVRTELCSEAIRLGRLLARLMPDDAETAGLLALMLIHDARREARVGGDGRYVALPDQDRARWDLEALSEGRAQLERALRLRRTGPYQLQAAIAVAALRGRGRLAADRRALPAAGVHGALAGRRGQPRGRAGHGREPRRRPGRCSIASSSTATSPSTSPTPSCCAAAATTRPPTAPTPARSSSARTRWSERSSSAAAARTDESWPPPTSLTSMPTPAQAPPAITGVDFVTLPAKDIEASRHFYGTVLGLPFVKNYGDMPASEYQAGNLTLAIMEPGAFGQEFRPHGLPVALQVDDVAAARAALEAQGVEFVTETFDSGVCHQAIFLDPAGNSLDLHHRYAPGGGLS